MVDLRPDLLEKIKSILAAHVPEFEVRVFGSRLKKTEKRYADLDLVIMTEVPLSSLRMAYLREAFSESDLPIKVDILDWAAIGDRFRRIIEEGFEVLQTPIHGD